MSVSNPNTSVINLDRVGSSESNPLVLKNAYVLEKGKKIWITSDHGFRILGLDQSNYGDMGAGLHDFDVNDSKQLSEKKREKLYQVILEQAVAVGIGIADAAEIDELNIYQATRKAMLQAVQKAVSGISGEDLTFLARMHVHPSEMCSTPCIVLLSRLRIPTSLIA